MKKNVKDAMWIYDDENKYAVGILFWLTDGTTLSLSLPREVVKLLKGV